MAVSGVGRGQSMCVVHHDRPAVTRCSACHKPICNDCIVSTKDGKFCSRECAGRAADFQKGKPKVGGGGFVMSILRIVVGVLILVVALGLLNKFVFKGKMPVIGPALNRLPVLGTEPTTLEKMKEGAGDVFDKARNGAGEMVDKAKDAVNR